MQVKHFRFRGSDVKADIEAKYGYSGPLLELYGDAVGAVVHKWHHYIPLYDRYFSPYRGKKIRFLEIGVFKGGSLRLWRNYFGPEATIFGIDIDPACAVYDGQHGQVRIGSQDDPEFLRRVVDEMGGVDVVLDDGSHMMAHIRDTLAELFPLLSDGGLYMIEDLHTAYSPVYGGSENGPENFFADLLPLIDVMHRWYRSQTPGAEGFAKALSGLHVHDSIVVLEKGAVHRPTHSLVGNGT